MNGACERVVGYVRVSTDAQAEEGISLHSQIEKLRRYAELFGLHLVEVHEDPGASGKTLVRPGLNAALACLDAGRAEGLLVAKLDRLSRSVVDMGHLVESYFQKYALISVADQIDTSTASGRMLLNLLTTVAQWERETIGERTAEALRHLKAQGVKLGRDALGWRRSRETDDHGRKLVVEVEEEIEAIERIRELRSRGYPLRAIASTLTIEGHKTKRGGRWHGSTVRAILQRYVGGEGGHAASALEQPA